VNTLHIKLIEVSSRIQEYNQHLLGLYNNMTKVLDGSYTTIGKRRKNIKTKDEVRSIHDSMGNYFDIMDGLRDKLIEERDLIQDMDKQVSRLERCLKRVRTLSNKLMGLTSTTPQRDKQEIVNEFESVNSYLKKYL